VTGEKCHEMPEIKSLHLTDIEYLYILFNTRMKVCHTCAHHRKGAVHSSPGVSHSDLEISVVDG
jgi:hypothetical protein